MSDYSMTRPDPNETGHLAEERRNVTAAMGLLLKVVKDKQRILTPKGSHPDARGGIGSLPIRFGTVTPAHEDLRNELEKAEKLIEATQTALVEQLANLTTDIALSLLSMDDAMRSSVENMLRQLPHLMEVAQSDQSHARLRQWVDAIAPVTLPAPLEERAVLSSRHAIQSFIDHYHATFLTAKQVSSKAHLTGKNVAATPGKWATEGKVFRLNYGGQFVYPGFQFDDAGNPYAILKAVLAALRQVPDRNDWGLAVWFGSNNGWLGGKDPAQCLATEPNQVLMAAEQDAAHLEH